MRQSVCILGATGSIGQSTLKVLAEHQEIYQLYAVTAQSRMAELAEICEKFQPKVAVVPSLKADELATLFNNKNINTEILTDEQGLIAVSSSAEVDIVMSAIVGAAGLLPTLAAVKAGKKVLLANKESLVMSGDIMMQAVQQYGATLLPVDSEHNAIFQCLPVNYTLQTREQKTPQLGVSKVILTASGGPFLNFSSEELQSVTPEQACKHPNWSMGRKISVDSASLMNKGLELIEACHLFQLDEQFVDVVIHPQSIIHSMVQYSDGSTLAQMGNPDMCTPIAHALAYPQRITTQVPALDLCTYSQLNFLPPDNERFPALNLARQAIKVGGTQPTVLNAVNEIAVDAFLNRKIAFVAITQLVEDCLNAIEVQQADSIETILSVDEMSRNYAQQLLTKYAI